MKRIGRLIRATDQEISQHAYQKGLQSMWEARWRLLGEAGKVQWHRRHGARPAAICPLVEPLPTPALSLALSVLRGVRGLTPRAASVGRYRRVR